MNANAIRLLLFMTAFSVGLLLGGCHGHRAPAAKYAVVNRGTYAYQRVNDGEFVIEATTKNSLAQALEEIGCGKDAVCLIEREGDVYDVQQRKK